MPSKDDLNADYARASGSTRIDRVARNVRVFVRLPACLGLALDPALRRAITSAWRTELSDDLAHAYAGYVREVAGPVALLADRLSTTVLEIVRTSRPDLSAKDLGDTFRDRVRTEANAVVVELLTRRSELVVEPAALGRILDSDAVVEPLVTRLVGRPLVEEARPLPVLTADQEASVDALVREAYRHTRSLRARVASWPAPLPANDIDEIVQDALADYGVTLRRSKILDPAFDASTGDGRWAQKAYVFAILRTTYLDHVKRAKDVADHVIEHVRRTDDEAEAWLFDIPTDERLVDDVTSAAVAIRALFIAAADLAGGRAADPDEPHPQQLRVCERVLRRFAGQPRLLDFGGGAEAGDRAALTAAIVAEAESEPGLLAPDASVDRRERVVRRVLTTMRELLADAGAEGTR